MFTDYKNGVNGWKYETITDVSVQTDIFPKNAILTQYIELSLLGCLTVKKGYNYDGASGAIDTDTIMLGSLYHDSLFQLMREKHLDKTWRIIADKLLKSTCITEGMNYFRASYVYLAVRLVGWYFVK